MRTAFAVGLVSLSVGCGVDAREPVEPVARLDLRAAMRSDAVEPVGFALADDGTRYVFDQDKGLFRVEGDSLVEIVGMSAMPDPGPTAPIKPPFTDLLMYAPNVFAITAVNDGYLLDTNAMTLTQHFCYLPGEELGTPVVSEQRTDAIAYDAARNRIYAQPISRDAAGTFIKADVATYDAATGADLEWNEVMGNVAATAMLISAVPGELILGQDAVLSRYTGRWEVQQIEDLGRFGVASIDGMAIDRAANTLIVVDKQTDAMFDIDLAQLDIALE